MAKSIKKRDYKVHITPREELGVIKERYEKELEGLKKTFYHDGKTLHLINENNLTFEQYRCMCGKIVVKKNSDIQPNISNQEFESSIDSVCIDCLKVIKWDFYKKEKF